MVPDRYVASRARPEELFACAKAAAIGRDDGDGFDSLEPMVVDLQASVTSDQSDLAHRRNAV